MRYFYYIPEGKNIIDFTVSPGHYGRSFTAIKKIRDDLIIKINRTINSEKLGFFQPDDAAIDIGMHQWDKGIVRVRLQVRILEPLDIKSIEEAGFSPYPYPEDFNCY